MNELQIHNQARMAAQRAVDEAIEKYGRNNAAFNYCGFGWAIVKPARGKFVNELKRHDIGRNGVYGGWHISNYDMFDLPPDLSQSMELKEIGVGAYVDYLRQNGIPASAHSRAD